MNIYVVYHDLDYDGCSIPMGAFSTKEKAEEFIKLLPKCQKGLGFYEIETLILDDWTEEWVD